jgi:hypothetical protein
MATDGSMRLRPASGTDIGLVVVLACVLAVIPNAVIGGSDHTENDVKSAFIYNFAKFVEFPSGTFASADSPIMVGVFGDSQFGDVLEKLLKGKTVGGRKLEVKRLQRTRDCDACQIVFVRSSESERVSSILDRLKNKSILTIGEAERFARRGGIIGFVTDNDRIGFQVNIGTAKRCALKISSKLLSLAREVIT